MNKIVKLHKNPQKEVRELVNFLRSCYDTEDAIAIANGLFGIKQYNK